MATIQVGGPLRPRSSLNTPLDDRTVIATLSLIQSIPLPFVGMLVYCQADGKYYKVTALNQDQDAVASYEEFPNPSQSGSSGSSPAPVEIPHTETALTITTLDGGTLHTCANPLTSLTVSALGQNQTLESIILFQTDENWNGLTLPSQVRYAPMQPILSPQTSYLLSLQNGIAVISPVTE